MTKTLSSHFHTDEDARTLIVCDMNDTLFGANGTPKFLNEALLKGLYLARQNGYRVQFYSNDQHGNQATLELVCQKHFGDPSYFGDVASKIEFEKKPAFIAIDDNHLSHGTKAVYRLGPLDYDRLAALTVSAPAPSVAPSPKP